MKKLFIYVAAATLTLTSCTNNADTTSQSVNPEDAGITAENFHNQLDSLVTAGDSAAVYVLLTKSQEQIDNLIAQGDTTVAKTLFEKVREVVTAQKNKIIALAPSMNEVINGTVNNIPASLKGIVTEGVDSITRATLEEGNTQLNKATSTVKEDAKAKVAEGLKKAEEVKKDAKEVKNKVEKAANDVKDAANKTKQAADAFKNMHKQKDQ